MPVIASLNGADSSPRTLVHLGVVVLHELRLVEHDAAQSTARVVRRSRCRSSVYDVTTTSAPAAIVRRSAPCRARPSTSPGPPTRSGANRAPRRPVGDDARRGDHQERPRPALLADRGRTARAPAASCPAPCRRRGSRRARCPTGTTASSARRAGTRAARPAARGRRRPARAGAPRSSAAPTSCQARTWASTTPSESNSSHSVTLCEPALTRPDSSSPSACASSINSRSRRQLRRVEREVGARRQQHVRRARGDLGEDPGERDVLAGHRHGDAQVEPVGARPPSSRGTEREFGCAERNSEASTPVSTIRSSRPSSCGRISTASRATSARVYSHRRAQQ